MPDEIRLDAAGRLGNITTTPQGGARIPASLTRAGVLSYKDPSFPGGMRREWRPASEVFSAKAIAAIQSLPVIVGHSAWITPANYKAHVVGVVDAGTAKQRGSFLDGTVTVQEQDALRRTDAGELGDLSLGYSLKYTPGAGIVPAGEPDAGKRYDGVQSNLVANHLALLQPGKARAEVGFRFDSQDDPLAGAPVLVSEPPEAPALPHEKKMALIIRLDSKEYDCTQADQALALQAACDKIRQDAREATDAKIKADGLIEGYKATIGKLELDAKDTTRLDSLVAERVALETTARTLIGDSFNGKGKSNREIMIDVIRQDSKDFTGLEADGKTAKPDSFVEGRFDSVVERLPNADSINSLRGVLGPQHTPPNMPRRQDSREDNKGKKLSASERARIANETRTRTAWQGPQAAPDQR